MNVNVTEYDTKPLSVPESDAEMLQEVYRRVVRMHSAVVERTNDDKDIVPWTEREGPPVGEQGAFSSPQIGAKLDVCRAASVWRAQPR